MQIEEEKKEKERKEQEVKLNKLESLIYKSRRDDVVKQNRPLLDKLDSLLKWVDDDGQLAGLGETMAIIEEVKENVSFLQSCYALREVFQRSLRLSHGAAVWWSLRARKSKHSRLQRGHAHQRPHLPHAEVTIVCASSDSIAILLLESTGSEVLE